jgi:NAD(P)-dependent dehydrogenase (short-subunit alcohol dehydrogenase family)
MSESSLPNFFDFSGSVVLVTGGGSGLGAAISRRFAQGGASVAVNYHRSEDAAARTVSEIEAQGGHAAALQADVTDPDQAAQLIARTIEAFSRLDILINNAGIYPLSPLLELDPDEWDRVIDANLRSTFLCTQAAARQWIAQGTGGAVVNIASIEGINPAPGHSHYNAAKGGVIMATRSMANELGEHGIRINAVSPGLLWREGIDRDWPEGVTRYRQAAPLGRLGRPAEVADACLFLASPAARWITGINLIVDGGVMTNQIY